LGARVGFGIAAATTKAGSETEFRSGSRFTLEVSNSCPQPRIIPAQASDVPIPETLQPFVTRTAGTPQAFSLLAIAQDAMGGKSWLAAVRNWERNEIISWNPDFGLTVVTTLFANPYTMRHESASSSRIVGFSKDNTGYTWSSTTGRRSDLPQYTAREMTFCNLSTMILSDNDLLRELVLVGPDAS
jgi:hypothetical protein